MKGIVMLGGSGSRLFPVTNSINKHLLPIYDKPLFYYPLSTLMLAGIRDIHFVCSPDSIELFKKSIGHGEELGIEINYFSQLIPNGIVGGLKLVANEIEGSSVALILGDNIFHGNGMGRNLKKYADEEITRIVGFHVSNPSDYGVIKMNGNNLPESIIEKPDVFVSNYAVPGLYFYDSDLTVYLDQIKQSERGEFEITTLNNLLLKDKKVHIEILQRGTVWIDAGTPERLKMATDYVFTIQERLGYSIGNIHEIAYKNGWINETSLRKSFRESSNDPYSKYILSLLEQNHFKI